METTISNRKLTTKINSKGAELFSLQKGDREYMWEGNPEIWGKHSPVLFPIVGTLKNSEFQYDSKRYSLSRHGFARDMEFNLIRQTENSAVFSLQSNDETLKIYPFDFEFQIHYILAESNLTVAYKIINRSDFDMFFSVGAHPAFALPLSFEDYSIEMEKDTNPEYHLLENDLLSENTEVLSTNDKKFRLNYTLFQNDALIFKNLKSRSLILLEKEKPLVKIHFEHFPYLGIWTKNNAPFICIEPWFGHSDPVNASGKLTHKEGIQILAPTAQFDCAFSIEIL